MDGIELNICNFLHYLKTEKRYRLPRMSKLIRDLNHYIRAGNLKYSNTDSNVKLEQLTENKIKELGWKFTKTYTHDQYTTNRYGLGCMSIEFTYENEELFCVDVTITELNCMPISFNQAKLLTELVGFWK